MSFNYNVSRIHINFFYFQSTIRHKICLSDWSSDVCSSDLQQTAEDHQVVPVLRPRRPPVGRVDIGDLLEIGRASGRENEKVRVDVRSLEVTYDHENEVDTWYSRITSNIVT